jgi:TonB family protein
MKKKKGFILSIDNPCPENWDNMPDTGADKNARHCANCNKSVIDFSNYTDKELLEFISKTKENICGRLSPYQMDRPILSYEPNNNSLLQKFMLGTALATSLAACTETSKNNTTPPTTENYKTVGEIKPLPATDTTPKNNYISGTIRDDKDTVPIDKITVSIKGTEYHAVTNIDGYFKIDVPDSLMGKKITLLVGEAQLHDPTMYNSKKISCTIDKLPFDVKIKLNNAFNDLPPVQGNIISVPPPMPNGGLMIREIPEDDSDRIVCMVPTMPKFNGDVNRYVAENIVYPKEMKDAGIEGTVYVSFVVEKSGEVSNVKAIRGVRSQLDSAATKVIANMPKWIPGMENGKYMRVQYTIPIRFQLSDSAKG